MRWLRLGLVAVPVSWLLAGVHASPLAVFLMASLAVVPLAAEMGEATEALAERTGPAVGGLTDRHGLLRWMGNRTVYALLAVAGRFI